MSKPLSPKPLSPKPQRFPLRRVVAPVLASAVIATTSGCLVGEPVGEAPFDGGTEADGGTAEPEVAVGLIDDTDAGEPG